MRNTVFVGILLLPLTACATVAAEPTTTIAPSTATLAPPTEELLPPTWTPIPPTPDITADWPEYLNDEFGYAFRYPPNCSLGPLAPGCKQNPPEERPPECLCFLNGEDPKQVLLQSFLGEPASGLTLVTFSVVHQETPAFNPPEGADLAGWLNSEWGYLSEEIPAEPNLTLDDQPAIRVFTPGGQGAYSAEYIFFLKDGKLFQINTIDVDPEQHQMFYQAILSTFRIIQE